MDMIDTKVRDLTRQEYEQIRRLVYAQSGINLGSEKMQLVRSRLGKIVRTRGFSSFQEYFEYVLADSSNGERMSELLDAISTNTTYLFREDRHFAFLRGLLQTLLAQRFNRSETGTLRIWSAACSSGEEPHSIAMVARDELRTHPNVQLKILATDISIQMLRKARQGRYGADQVSDVPAELRNKYLKRVRQDGVAVFHITPEIERAIQFARFNLMTESYPFRNSFDIVFCRNVMIYFDKQTQAALVRKFEKLLLPGGHLFIGHSESLHGIDHSLRQVEPATFVKP